METKHKTSSIGQQIVPTPKWLQKKILENLTKTSKSKIFKERAKRSQEILDSIKKQREKINKTAPAETSVQTADIQTPVTNHHPNPNNNFKKNRQSFTGNVIQRFKRYLGRLWKR